VYGDKHIGIRTVGNRNDLMQTIGLQVADHLNTCGTQIVRREISDILCHITFPQPIPARTGIWIPVRRMTCV